MGLTFGGLTLVQTIFRYIKRWRFRHTDIKLRNVGTYASPLDMGHTQQNGVSGSELLLPQLSQRLLTA